MNDPSTSTNPHLEEVNTLRQRLLELEQSHGQCQQQIEQLTQQLAQESAARQQAEDRLQLILTSAQMVAWDRDLITNRVVCSPNALEMWGIQAGSGEDFVAVIHPEDRPQVVQAVQRAIAGETAYFQEYRVVRPDGVIRWLNSQGQVYLDATGRGIRMLGISVDVTEQKQAEAALRESEDRLRVANERFQLAAKAVNCLIYDWYVEANRVERTDGLTKLLGYALEEIEPTAEWWRDRVHPEDLQLVLGQATLVLAKEDYFTAEYRVLNKSNQYIYVLDQCLVVTRDANGTPTRIVGSTTNISDRKQAELQLQESQRFIQQILDTLPGTLYIYDMLEHRNIYVNRQIGELVGYTPEQIQKFGDQLFPQLMHPEDFAKLGIQVDLLNQAHDGEVVDHEYRLRHADGEWRWFWSRNTVSTRTPDGRAQQVVGTLHDITARKWAEEELRASEQRLQLAQQAGRIGTWEWNLLTNTIAWSDGIWTLLALEPNSITPTLESFTQFIHPEDREQVFKKVEVALAQEDDYCDEFRVIRHDGVIRWLLSKGKVIRAQDGQPERLLGINVDISDRKRAEAALAKSNQTLQAVIAASPLAIIGLRADGTVQIWNPAAERIFGWSQEEVLGKFLPAIPDNKRDEFLNNLALTIQGQGLVGLETQRQRKGNLLFDVELWSASVDEAQAGISCVWVIADISERKRIEEQRKQAEESLRQSEERLRLALLVGMSGIWDWDIANNHITWSEQIYQFHGLTPETFSGKVEDFTELIHPEDRAKVSEAIRYALEERSNYEIEFRAVQPSGAIRWLSTTGGTIFDQQGQPLRMLGATIDITERKAIEAEREQLLKREQSAREQAEVANRIKDEFLAVLSHELRTPLNPILGWTKLLRTRQFDRVATDRALETIERNAKLQAQLIEDLLDVSRILQGKVGLKASPINLIATIEAALETVRLSAEAKGIQIQKLLDPQVGQVNGDTNRLQQVLWNLLANAVKFTPSGGRVEVRLEQIGTYAQIQVSDTGLGISPDFLPYVFEYFRQADSSTTRQFGGLGLGLAIVRHLVELHGGTVEAESLGLGKGARFTVQLPLMVSASTPDLEIPPTQDNKNLSGICILIVDDEADMRDLIRFILEEQGATVRIATSAAEALQQVTESMPDLLISDIGMPEMDGYALMRQIRALSTEKKMIPAIALTAYAGEINQRQALEAGFQLHLAKPIEPEQLVRTVAQVVAQSFNP